MGSSGNVCFVDPRAQCLSSLPSPHDTIFPSSGNCSLPLPLCCRDENSSAVTNPGRLHNPLLGVGSLQDGPQWSCFLVITPLYNPLFLNVGWIYYYWLTSNRIHRRHRMTLLRWSYEKAVNSIVAIFTGITCLGEANCHVPEQPMLHGMGERPAHNYVSELENNLFVPSQVFRWDHSTS